MTDGNAHWDRVYTEKRAEEVIWRPQEPTLSLKLIARTGIGRDAATVDVGAGASTLVDHLLLAGCHDLTVLDIAASGLERAKARLQGQAQEVKWVVVDVTAWRPVRKHRLWHDRAVLHFLTDPSTQVAYFETLRCALDGDGGAAPFDGDHFAELHRGSYPTDRTSISAKRRRPHKVPITMITERLRCRAEGGKFA